MKFYYGGSKNEDYQNLAHSATFQQLCSYLYLHEGTILRDLKKNIPMKNLEKTIDLAIELNLILREERRYRLLFPIVTKELVTAIEKKADFQITLSQLQQSPAAIVAAFEDYEHLMKQDYFYGVIDTIALAEVALFKSDTLQFVSCQLDAKYDTIPSYFEALKQEQLTETNPLYAILGDVDPIYAGLQFAYIIERVVKGKKVRPSIFSRALSLTGILMVNEESSLELKVPLLAHTDEKMKFEKTDLLKWRLLLTSYLAAQNAQTLQFILLNGN